MAIRSRHKGLQIDVKVGQTRHREIFHGTLEDAQVREAVIRKALKEGNELPQQATVSGSVCPTYSSDLLLEKALETIWERYWSEGGQARTVRSNMKTCIEYFGADRDIRTITTQDADAYVEWCKHQGWASSTIKLKCHPMPKMFSHFHRRGNVPNPPFFETPKLGNNERTRVITDAEFDELIDLFTESFDKFRRRADAATGQDFADFFTFLMDTGLRPSEAYQLKPMNLVGDLLHVKLTKTDNPRTIPLTERAMAAFVRQAAQREDNPFEWARWSYSKAWEGARDEMGLGDDEGCIPYALRHTCATRLYARTRDLMVVQKWLGHKNIQMTLRYAKLMPDDLQKARDLLQAA